MHAATLIGLVFVLLGFLWIYIFGTNVAGIMLLAGAAVGVVYSNRPTPAHRAGARTGIFAAIPEAIVQVLVEVPSIWESSAPLATKVTVGVLFSLLGLLAIWVVGALFCIASAFVTSWIIDHLRSFLPRSAFIGGQ